MGDWTLKETVSQEPNLEEIFVEVSYKQPVPPKIFVLIIQLYIRLESLLNYIALSLSYLRESNLPRHKKNLSCLK